MFSSKMKSNLGDDFIRTLNGNLRFSINRRGSTERDEIDV